MKLFKWCLSGELGINYSLYSSELLSFFKTEHFLSCVRGAQLPYNGEIIGQILDAYFCEHKTVCMIFKINTTKVNIKTFIPGFKVKFGFGRVIDTITEWYVLNDPGIDRMGLEEIENVNLSLNYFQNRELGI